MTRKEKDQLYRAVIRIHCLCDYWGGMSIIKSMIDDKWPAMDYWQQSPAERQRMKRTFNQWVKKCKEGTSDESI